MKKPFTKVIYDILKNKTELNLDQLYEILVADPQITWDEITLKTRIRTSLFKLQKNNLVKRAAPKTYKIV